MSFLIQRSDLVALRYSLDYEKFYLWQDCGIEEAVIGDVLDLLNTHILYKSKILLSKLRELTVSVTKEDATVLLKLHDELIRVDAVLENRAIYKVVNEIWNQMIEQELAGSDAT
jgi:hypothetical protein